MERVLHTTFCQMHYPTYKPSFLASLQKVPYSLALTLSVSCSFVMCYQPGLSTETTANHILIRSEMFGFLGLRFVVCFWFGWFFSCFCVLFFFFFVFSLWLFFVCFV